MAVLNTEIEFLKGVGPARAATLKSELGIKTCGDLLLHLPFRYVDRSKFYNVRDIVSDAAFVQLKGELTRITETQGKGKRISVTLQDETGSIELVWFRGIQFIKNHLHYNKTYVIYGKPSRFKGKWNIAHPELELYVPGKENAAHPFRPVYPSTEKLGVKGLGSSGIARLIETVLPLLHHEIKETLPADLLAKMNFPEKETAIKQIHRPSDFALLDLAKKRIKFEELFFLQLLLLAKKHANTYALRGVRFEAVGANFMTFYEKHLPFELTNAQKRVVKEIRSDTNTGRHMNRLLQGDVGSGKTIVSLLCALLAIDNGFQVALMAPTEILANQHFESFQAQLEALGVRVELLTGSVKIAKRREIHEGLENGDVKILVGTHALIEPKVKFKNLGLSIIDEQHRFGVAQRSKLWAKAAIPPHVLVMTATPIPRTLAMTVYGDLDISVIDELPPGRKEIKTIHRTDSGRVQINHFIQQEIEKGRQIYIVYPLIEESKAMDYKDLMDGYESISRRFPPPEYKLSIVHGRMRPEDKDYEMRMFVKGSTQILVATTVIEVGVNVPNASVMVIESTERFGLSQLHQLRGRVGRGAEQSYCVLMSGEKLSQQAKKRIHTMCSTNDGFEIAEVDLQLRGAGDLMGTQQSGEINLDFADLSTDRELLVTARHLALEIVEEDPMLEQEKNALLLKGLNDLKRKRPDWSRIS
ncbi:MAG: ATP-dependent DNA helicase RecG [Flavobacteriales bacterium]|jgi:ATP-dependent DNA helicase RecG